ncbi:MAG TPA: glycosyltransferase family 4 protein, partial [Magnetospirillum sp.]|nr:glycosyltransferase family 4 protein [Magnetospirillum sp.]
GHAFGIPTILHLHGADFAEFCRGLSPHGRRLVKDMVHRAESVVTLGSCWRDFAMAELDLPAERIEVLPNAVPGPERIPDHTHHGPCRILFLGVLGPRKGVPVLLRALASPMMQGFAWEAMLAGNGEISESKALAQLLGIAERLTFTGWVAEDKAHELLAWADLLVLPSRNEGLPMAILEAMAWGLPVVSTPVGAIPDAVEHGSNGFLLPVGDEVALAAALSLLAEDAPLRRRMGAASRLRWARDFDIRAYNRRLEALFRRVRDRRDGLAPQGKEGFAR